MRSAKDGSQPQRTEFFTGVAHVPCALAFIRLSSPIIGYFDPGAALPPLQPSLRSDVFVVEDIDKPMHVIARVPNVLDTDVRSNNFGKNTLNCAVLIFVIYR